MGFDNENKIGTLWREEISEPQEQPAEERSRKVMQSLSARPNRESRLVRLRQRIARIERGPTVGKGPIGDKTAGGDPARATAMGPAAQAGDAATIDPFLEGGDGLPALHELIAGSYLDQPAARDFALALIASLMHRHPHHQRMVLCCRRRLDIAEFGQLYGPGLKALGLPPERFLMVTGRRDADCLWAMEQGLASRSLLAVVGAVDHADLIATRRLSLAARAHGAFCFLLPVHQGRDPSAARTRWRVRAAPSMSDHLDPEGLGKPAWRLDLERSPNGRTGHWTVEWDHAAHHFHLARSQPAAGSTCQRQKNGGRDKHVSDVVAFERAG